MECEVKRFNNKFNIETSRVFNVRGTTGRAHSSS